LYIKCTYFWAPLYIHIHIGRERQRRGRKQPFLHFRYHIGTCFEGLRGNQKENYCQDSRCRIRDSNRTSLRHNSEPLLCYFIQLPRPSEFRLQCSVTYPRIKTASASAIFLFLYFRKNKYLNNCCILWI
jgi:hypothetical protein